MRGIGGVEVEVSSRSAVAKMSWISRIGSIGRCVLSEAELSREGWRSWKRSGAVSWGCQSDEDLTVDDEVR